MCFAIAQEWGLWLFISEICFKFNRYIMYISINIHVSLKTSEE